MSTTPPPMAAPKAALPHNIYHQSHEVLPPAPKMEFDTTTPMVKPGSVTRFTTVDTPKYGPWLLPKLTARWPNISAMTFSGWMMGWTSGNTFLFIKNEHAVGLAEVYKQTPDIRPKAREIFVFCESKDYEEDALQIYREFKRWGRSLGVAEIKDIGNASDLSNARLRSNCAAKTDNSLVFEL